MNKFVKTTCLIAAAKVRLYHRKFVMKSLKRQCKFFVKIESKIFNKIEIPKDL